MNTKTIKFDLNKFKLYEKIKAKQGDTKSRFLLFQLLDGSAPFNLKNRSVRAYMIKPDGKEIFNDLIVNNYNLGYCTLELTNQVLAVPGTLKIELMVTEGDKKLTSSVFELEVVKSINSEKSIVSTNEFTALLNGLAALSEYDNYKNSVKEMEINKANKAEVEEKFISVEEKIKNNSEQLEQIEKQLIKNEFYVARHKNLMRLYNNISKFKGLVGGDSIMAGAGSTNFNARFDWQLATYLQANIHGNTVSDYLPVNIAVGGTSINQIIHSLGIMVDNKGIPLKSGVTKTSYWIIGTGRNDTTNKDVNSYCKKLREICSQANKLKVDLFIVTAPPKFSNGNVVDGYTGDENYLEIKRNMIRIASEFDVSIIDFHSYMMNRLKTESIRNLYYSDDVHLNDNGQLLLANLVGECMLHESFSDSFNSNFDGDNGRYIMTYLEPSYVNGAIKETLESIPENMVLAHTGIKAAYKIPAGSSVAFPVPQFLNDATIYVGTLSQLTTGKYNVTSWTTGNIALNQATPQQHNSQYEYVNCIRTIPNVIQGAIQIEAVGGDVYLTGITCISSKLTYKSLTDGFALSGDWKKTYLGLEKQYYKSSTIGNSFSFEFFGTGFSLNLPTDSTGCLCNILIDNEISIDKSLVTVSAGLNNETTVGNLKQGYHKVTVSIKSTGSNGGSDCYIGEWLKVYNNYQNGEYVKSYTNVDVYNEMINYDFIEDEFTNSEHYITFSGTKLINMINI